MSEANKKTPRTFSCRNSLWDTFQEMSDSLECSVDYLVNDAMKHYARQRGFTRTSAQQVAPAAATPLSGAGAAPPPSPLSSESAARPQTEQVAFVQAAPAQAAPAAQRPLAPSLQPARRIPAAPTPGLAPAPPRQAHASSQMSSMQATNILPRPPEPPVRGTAPLPPPPRAAQSTMPPPGAQATPAPHLVLVYAGQAFPVSKERYIIGRGKSSSDMTIRDPNISRQHATVELSQGVYYMVDLGSTNGIEFGGQRVQRKVIHHGDVFKICDHEVTCQLS